MRLTPLGFALGLVALVAVYFVGYHAGMVDQTARLVVFEDGSYPAGCLPGNPCDDR